MAAWSNGSRFEWLVRDKHLVQLHCHWVDDDDGRDQLGRRRRRRRRDNNKIERERERKGATV